MSVSCRRALRAFGLSMLVLFVSACGQASRSSPRAPTLREAQRQQGRPAHHPLSHDEELQRGPTHRAPPPAYGNEIVRGAAAFRHF